MFIFMHGYVGCVVGVGANLSVWLPWELAAGITAGQGYPSSGLLLHSTLVSYPAPVLAATTLRLNESDSVTLSQNEEYSYAIVPGGGDSYWLAFSGENFGFFPDLVRIDYSNENGTFVCVSSADPILVNGPSGSINDTEIICRTATGELEGTYFLTVAVGGQVSETSLDQLIFPAVPFINSIEGCPTNRDQGTYDCPTLGGTLISIYGRNLQAGMVALFTHLTPNISYLCSLLVLLSCVYAFLLGGHCEWQ